MTTGSGSAEATWLPNLVGGTSIWKLAVDLNESKFFDGRLLVPETEGSESLPVTVRWDLTNLIPLSEAQAKYPEETGTAVKEFQECLARVAKVFSTPNSGFDKYKEAFTVPSLEVDNGANYFYSPERKKLFVINWGASPRSMGGKAEYVFGYEDWGKHWGDPGAAVAPAPAIAAGVGIAAGAAVAAAAAKKADEKKDAAKEAEEAKKKDEKGRPWWIWPLFGLIVIALILLALFLLKACEDQKNLANVDGAADALVEGAASDGSTEAGADGAAVADDAGADAAGADGGDAGADAASADGGDAGKDAGKDSGLAWEDEDDDDDNPTTNSSGGVLKVTGGGGGGGVVVKIGKGPTGGQKTSLHRKHFSDDAVKWRVASGAQKVSRTEQQPSGKQYDVWLAPGNTFEGVKVEWKDKSGHWHIH